VSRTRKLKASHNGGFLKLTLLTVICIVGLCAAGCKKSAVTDDNGAALKPIAGQGTSAPVYDRPPSGIQAGSGYSVAPANPNDPRFKADPKLAGGH